MVTALGLSLGLAGHVATLCRGALAVWAGRYGGRAWRWGSPGGWLASFEGAGGERGGLWVEPGGWRQFSSRLPTPRSHAGTQNSPRLLSASIRRFPMNGPCSCWASSRCGGAGGAPYSPGPKCGGRPVIPSFRSFLRWRWRILSSGWQLSSPRGRSSLCF